MTEFSFLSELSLYDVSVSYEMLVTCLVVAVWLYIPASGLFPVYLLSVSLYPFSRFPTFVSQDFQPFLKMRLKWSVIREMMTFQDVSWLVQVALFCASLLVVLAWLVQFSLGLLRPRWSRVQGKRETPWRLPLSLTHQTLTGGVWGSLLRLRLGRDGAGTDTEAGVKGLLSSLFVFKSFREHWQRAWVRALNEQACRQGVSNLLSWDKMV